MKKVSTLIGIIIIVVTAIILIGGVFVWQYITPKDFKILTPVLETRVNNSNTEGTNDCKLVCSWSPCIDGSQQQYINDPNWCLSMFEDPSPEEQKQIDACPQITKICSPSIPAAIFITPPLKTGEFWRQGQLVTIKYSVSITNTTDYYYIDSFLVDQSGKKFVLSKGEHLGDSITFVVKDYDKDIEPGKYKLELKAGLMPYPYSAWGITDDYITIEVGP